VRLIVDEGASGVCRRLRSLGWFVLVELVLSAVRDRKSGVLASAVGAREVGAALGISKDTAARGLGLLTQAGLITRETTRDAAGRFGACRYVLHLPAGLTCEAPEQMIEAVRSGGRGDAARPRRRIAPVRKRSARPANQLSLIDSHG